MLVLALKQPFKDVIYEYYSSINGLFTPFDLAKMAIDIGVLEKKKTLKMVTFRVIISSMCSKVPLEPFL